MKNILLHILFKIFKVQSNLYYSNNVFASQLISGNVQWHLTEGFSRNSCSSCCTVSVRCSCKLCMLCVIITFNIYSYICVPVKEFTLHISLKRACNLLTNASDEKILSNVYLEILCSWKKRNYFHVCKRLSENLSKTFQYAAAIWEFPFVAKKQSTIQASKINFTTISTLF